LKIIVIDRDRDQFKNMIISMLPIMATSNYTHTHTETKDPHVDLMFHSIRGISSERFTDLFIAAYNSDPQLTRRIIAHLRDCRGGKGERDLGRLGLQLLADRCDADQWRNLLPFFLTTYGRWDDAINITTHRAVTLDIIALQLLTDLESTGTVSLCAKWIPSENANRSFYHLLANHMHISPRDLRQKIISPLRARLNLVETALTVRSYDMIEFSHVPSRCMAMHGRMNMTDGRPGAFIRHCGEKYAEWKSSKNVKLNAGQLDVHEIVAQYMTDDAVVDDLIELQWQYHAEQIRSYPALRKTLVLSDVSGSMTGRPMSVSIALGLLISGEADEPWRNRVMTFETDPCLHTVTGDTLYQRVNSLKSAGWGGSTNLQACFELILTMMRTYCLTPDQMPERLVIVSDMQFNMCDQNYRTNLEEIRAKYRAMNYRMPDLVFWNVNGNIMDYPAEHDAVGVSLLSGFSTSLLKNIITGATITPRSTMMETLDNVRYSQLDRLGL